MARTLVEIEGMEAVREALRLVPDQARAVISDVVQKTAFGAKQRAVAMAPRDTGRLRDAITSRSRGLNGRVEVGPQGFYWRFLEYGTRSVAARPFVRPAAEMESREFTERVRQAGVRLERNFATSRLL